MKKGREKEDHHIPLSGKARMCPNTSAVLAAIPHKTEHGLGERSREERLRWEEVALKRIKIIIRTLCSKKARRRLR